jgi:UDP-GlcNAc:undecaprenyl-phosphate/decaprenyl-phosphate GlcNAc-1-phosphate transferase
MRGHEMLVGPALAFLVTALSIGVLRAPATRLGLVDHPDHRKRHQGVVPLIGGLALLVGFAAGYIPAPDGWSPHWSLLFGIALLTFVGVADDIRHISSRLRLAVQLIAALAVVAAGVEISSLGNLLGTGPIHLGWLAIPFTVLCIVMMINAINMLDGADGLAGSVTLLAAVGLAALALIDGVPGIAFAALILTSALLGFLIFNLRSPWVHRASVFLGDSGSTVLGFMLAFLAIVLTQRGDTGIAPISVAWVLLLPAADMLSVSLRRIRCGRSPLAADRSHFHHVLLRSGFSVRGTVGIIGLNQLLLVAAAIVLHLGGVPEPLQFAMAAAVFVVYLAFSLNARSFLRAMRQRRRRQVLATARLEMAED